MKDAQSIMRELWHSFWNSEFLFIKDESFHLNLLILFYAKTVEA